MFRYPPLTALGERNYYASTEALVVLLATRILNAADIVALQNCVLELNVDIEVRARVEIGAMNGQENGMLGNGSLLV